MSRTVRIAVKRFELSQPDPNETWLFLCECGTEACAEWVPLSLAEYEAIRRAERTILAPRHRDNRARSSRRRARRLIEEAEALCAQADLQLGRATRKLPNC